MEIQRGAVQVNFDGKSYELDLILLKLVCDELEAEFPLNHVGGFVAPQAGMLKAMAERLQSDFDLPATPTAAYQIWVRVNEGFIELKKSIESTPKSPTGLESTPTT